MGLFRGSTITVFNENILTLEGRESSYKGVFQNFVENVYYKKIMHEFRIYFGMKINSYLNSIFPMSFRKPPCIADGYRAGSGEQQVQLKAFPIIIGLFNLVWNTS